MAFSCDFLDGKVTLRGTIYSRRSDDVKPRVSCIVIRKKASLSCFRFSIRLIGINSLLAVLTDAEKSVQEMMYSNLLRHETARKCADDLEMTV